jgi:outer membrane protein OmpA-like peptidoglycan-associated protein
MKKVMVLIAYILCLTVFAQNKPKIAVYVIGGELKPNEIKMVETKILTPFVQSKQYTMVERGDPFLTKLATEMKKQRDGSVDDSQIRSLGKQAGVQFVCVTEIVEAFGLISVSARLINTESAEIPSMGETEIKELSEIGQAANLIFKQINDGKSVATNQNKQNTAIVEPVSSSSSIVGTPAKIIAKPQEDLKNLKDILSVNLYSKNNDEVLEIKLSKAFVAKQSYVHPNYNLSISGAVIDSSMFKDLIKKSSMLNKVIPFQNAQNAQIMLTLKDNCESVKGTVRDDGKTLLIALEKKQNTTKQVASPQIYDENQDVMKNLYNVSHSNYLRSEYAVAYNGFKQIYDSFKTGELAENSLYWMGMCMRGAGKKDNAEILFKNLLERYPQSPKVCLANLQLADMAEESKRTLEQKAYLQKLLGTEHCVKSNEFQRAAEILQKLMPNSSASVSDVGSLEASIKRLEELSITNKCRTNDKQKNTNCAAILQQLGQELYNLGKVNFNKQQDSFEELVRWCADRNNDVKKYPKCSQVSNPPKPNYDAALPIFLDYVKFFPDNQNAPNILYMASLILKIKGEMEHALKLCQVLVSKYPKQMLVQNCQDFSSGSNQPSKKKIFIVEGINFTSGKADIAEDSYANLMNVVEVMQAYPEVKFKVIGYTDNQETNQKLSENRAKTVVNFLVSRGISAFRLGYEGRGPDQPIASNNTVAGRAKNRRIEFQRTDN